MEVQTIFPSKIHENICVYVFVCIYIYIYIYIYTFFEVSQ